MVSNIEDLQFLNAPLLGRLDVSNCKNQIRIKQNHKSEVH
jgi:hypothetical protein